MFRDAKRINQLEALLRSMRHDDRCFTLELDSKWHKTLLLVKSKVVEYREETREDKYIPWEYRCC